MFPSHDPFPAYIPPTFINDSGEVVTRSSGDRSETGRLGKYFEIKDTPATFRSTQRKHLPNVGPNAVDLPENLNTKGGVVVFPDTGQFGPPLENFDNEFTRAAAGAINSLSQTLEETLTDLTGLSTEELQLLSGNYDKGSGVK